MMATNRPGTPIARNKYPNRTVSIATTAWVFGDQTGDVMNARQSNTKPNGNKNQPDRPKSVIHSNKPMNPGGKPRAQLLAAASSKNIDTKTTTSMSITAQ